MVQTTTSRPPGGTRPDPAQRHSWTDSVNTTALLFKILGVGLTLAIAIALSPALLNNPQMAIPAAVYGLLMFVPAGIFTYWVSRKKLDAPQASATP